MKIEDLVQLLNNRLGEFKLSKDYARMRGDLERMNTADKEVIALEDILFKLNLLIDTSKSAVIKRTTLAAVMSDGSVAVLGEYDITPYATDPLHEEKVMNILSKIGVMDTAEKIDDYIKGKYSNSPVTGEMVISATEAYTVDARLMMAIMEQDSRFGTTGKAVRTLNPGNVGNDDSGNLRTYESWQEGVTAVAEWLNRHRVSKMTADIPEEISKETVLQPTTTSTSLEQATPTSPFIESIATSTTPEIISEEPVVEPLATTTPPTTTTTTPTMTATTTSTTTPMTATTTPTTAVATTTPEIISEEPVVEPLATTTPPTTTTTTPTMTATTTSTTTPMTATTTPEIIPEEPVIEPLATTTPATITTTTSTTTPMTATTTPATATSTPITLTSTPTTATSTDSTTE